MPIYEYKCVRCGKIIEMIAMVGEEMTMMCQCGNTMRKIPSVPAVQDDTIIGGFYDYQLGEYFDSKKRFLSEARRLGLTPMSEKERRDALEKARNKKPKIDVGKIVKDSVELMRNPEEAKRVEKERKEAMAKLKANKQVVKYVENKIAEVNNG